MKMRVYVLRAAALAILASALGLGSAGAQTNRMLKLYVTNSEGDDITVIDLGTLKVIGDIKVGDHVHGAAVEPDGQRLFTTVESDHTLKVIDTATDQIIETIKLTGMPNQCAVTPNGRYVGVPIRGGDSVDIVDVTEKKVVKNLPVRVPHNCYNAHNNHHMFVTSMGDHEVNLIDLKTMSYIARIPVGGVPRPLAVSSDEQRMYVALSDLHGFVIVDIPHRRVIEKVELPAPPAGAQPLVAYTPTHGLDLTPEGKELWVTSMVGDGVYVYDIATKKLSEKIPTGRAPNWLTFSPDGRYCCVSNAGSDDCSIIDTKTRREVTRLKVGKMPKRLVVASVPSNPTAAPAP
jgi:YVTN family beta-propeller protein